MWQELEAINSQLIEARKTIRERDRILDLMAFIDNELIQKRKDLSILVTKLKYEKQDVKELETLSLAALYFKILGVHQDKLEQEVQEYLEAKLNVEQCKLTIASKENYQKELEAQLIALAKCDDQYTQLHQIQDEILLNIDHHKQHDLQKVIAQISQKQALAEEVNEAIEAGNVVNKKLNEIIKIINKGKDLTGGWSKLYSFDPIGEAVASSLILQPKLDRFQEELADITAQFWPKPSLRTPTDLRVNTILYTFTDSLMGMKYTEQNKIKIWLNHLKSLQNKIQIKITALQSKFEQVTFETTQLNEEKDRLIERMTQDFAVHS
jgi:hypothetical protein